MAIKVGFIGLGPGGWARGAHLPYLQKGGEYEIVAVCNTSVDSARRAIELYGLNAATKAYGSPEGDHLGLDTKLDRGMGLTLVSQTSPKIRTSS